MTKRFNFCFLFFQHDAVSRQRSRSPVRARVSSALCDIADELEVFNGGDEMAAELRGIVERMGESGEI